ncbi:MAG: hypothetical protein ACYCSQ_05280 [bacterium]
MDKNDKIISKINSQDLINAIGLYKAHKAGALGKVKLKEQTIGALSGGLSDIQDTKTKLLKGKIKIPEAMQAVKNTFHTTVKVVTNIAVTAVQGVIADVIPIVGPVLAVGIEIVKSHIVEKVTNKVVEIAGKVKSLFKRLFA